MRFFLLIKVCCMTLSLVLFGGDCVSSSTHGTLRISRINPRYFTDDSAKAIYLTGSHTWDNLQDRGAPTPEFDFTKYLDFLKMNNHNFIRLWKIGENSVKGGCLITPMPWERTGPGNALDGQKKFDLTKFNDDFFTRLRSRVVQAGREGIYTSIMLFDGIYQWETHPFNPANNVNGINGGDKDFFTLKNSRVNRLQEDYIRKVVDSVIDLDNVLFEIGNEIKRHSLEWQYYLINFLRSYEKTKGRQHPIGMTSTGGADPDDLSNKDLFASPADWISPKSSEPGHNYSYNPPPAKGQKVIISDTDHLWGILTDPSAGWVWKSFLRGLNPILMDVVQNRAPGRHEKWNDPDRPGLQSARRAMGQTLHFSKKLNLLKMYPMPELSSTGYCLADPGTEYLVYYCHEIRSKKEEFLRSIKILNRTLSVDLYAVKGQLNVEWFEPISGRTIRKEQISGGGRSFFQIPFEGDSVLHLYRGD